MFKEGDIVENVVNKPLEHYYKILVTIPNHQGRGTSFMGIVLETDRTPIPEVLKLLGGSSWSNRYFHVVVPDGPSSEEKLNTALDQLELHLCLK